MQALKRAANGYAYEALPRREQGLPAQPRRAKPVTRPKVAPKRKRRVYKKVEVSYVVHPRTRQMRRKALYNCFTIAVCFILLSVVVASYAKVSALSLENFEIEQNILDLEAQVEKSELAIATKCGIDEISKVAENNLDMGFPEESQIEYVQLKQPQETGQEVAPQKGWLAQLWDGFIALF